VASGRAWISCVINSDDTNVSAFSFIPINDLIRGLPPGALSSRTADKGIPHEDMIDHRSYTHNLSSCEIKV